MNVMVSHNIHGDTIQRVKLVLNFTSTRAMVVEMFHRPIPPKSLNIYMSAVLNRDIFTDKQLNSFETV